MKNIMGHALSVSHRISQVGRDQQWIVLSLVFVCFIMIKYMIKYFCCFFCCSFILGGGRGEGGGGEGVFFVVVVWVFFSYKKLFFYSLTSHIFL